MRFFSTLFHRADTASHAHAVLEMRPFGITGVLCEGTGAAKDPVRIASLASTDSERSPVSQDAIEERTGMLKDAVSRFVAAHSAFAHAKDVHIALGGEFLRSSVIRAEFERDDARAKIGEGEFGQWIEKAERAGREEVEERLRSPRSGRPDVRLVKAVLEEVRIDGYAVEDPVGLAGKNVEVALFNLYADEAFLEFLNDVKSILQVKKLSVYVTPHAVCRAWIASAAKDAPASAIFVELSESMTAVSVVSRNAFWGTKFFSVGRGMFTRALAGQLGIRESEARHMEDQYCAGGLSPQVARRMSAILKRSVGVWISGIELALEEFAGALELLPPSLMAYGAGTDIPDIAKALASPDAFKKLPFLEKRSSSILTGASLPQVTRGDMLWQAEGPCGPGHVGLVSLAYLSARAHTSMESPFDRLVERSTKLAYF